MEKRREPGRRGAHGDRMRDGHFSPVLIADACHQMAIAIERQHEPGQVARRIVRSAQRLEVVRNGLTTAGQSRDQLLSQHPPRLPAGQGRSHQGAGDQHHGNGEHDSEAQRHEQFS
jgi:hypothetical protein